MNNANASKTIQSRSNRSEKRQKREAVMPAGKYALSLLLVEPEATGEGQRVMKVSFGDESHEIDVFKQAGGKNRILVLEYPVELKEKGSFAVTLTPVKGKALICGAVLASAGK